MASFFYAKDIIPLLYTDATQEWNHVFSLLMITYIGVSMTYVYGTLLTANESIKKMNQIFFVGVLLNFGLNLYFIDKYMAVGAAIATIITQSLSATALILLAIKETALGPDLKLMVKMLSFAILCFGVLWFLPYVFDSWLQQLFGFFFLAALMSAVLGLLPIRMMVSMVKT